MIRPSAHRLLPHSAASLHRPFHPIPSLRLSTEASSSQCSPPQNPSSYPQLLKQETPNPNGGAAHKRRRSYEEEQSQLLRAALSHVPRLGWSDSAMISGARDVAVSPSFLGSFTRREAALVEFFMDDCLQKLIDHIDSGEELNNLILRDRLAKLIHVRLEMQMPYISKWSQALNIQAQPMNLPTSLKQRAVLVDKIWQAAGDQGSDIHWYVKRTVLGGIYSTSEVYMMTDHSPGYLSTWNFLERRIGDAFELERAVQEASYLAEAVGSSMGRSMQGFMKGLLHG